MRVVIMGCGWFGASLAFTLAEEGHAVIVIDSNAQSFARLPPSFSGTAMVGDGTDEDVLAAAGAEGADVCNAVTQGDNWNIMALQMVKAFFRVRRVITRIYDPIRQEIFKDLGLMTYSTTKVLTKMINEAIA